MPLATTFNAAPVTLQANLTPEKKLQGKQLIPVVSPNASSSTMSSADSLLLAEESSAFSSSSIAATDTDGDSTSSSIPSTTVLMTEHKRAEVENRHLPEPLLDENPGRFVLFPIQHADVSRRH